MALVTGVMFLVIGAVAVDIIYGIGQTVVGSINGTSLGILPGIAGTVKTLFTILGTVLLAAGGAFILYTIIKVFFSVSKETGAA